MCKLDVLVAFIWWVTLWRALEIECNTGCYPGGGGGGGRVGGGGAGRVWGVEMPENTNWTGLTCDPPPLSLSLLPPFLLLLLLLLLFPSFPRSLHQHHSQWLNAGSLNKTKWEKEAEERKIERKRERERERERELTNQEEKAKRRRIIRRGKMRNQKKK